MFKLASKLVTASFIALVAADCGGAPPVVASQTSEFTEAHEQIFDGRIDLIGDPTVLERAWRDEWDRAMQERITASDFVVLGRVATLRTAVNPEQRQTYHLGIVVEQRLLGNPPSDLDLAVADSAPGFATVSENQRQILEHMFVVFGKWQRREDGVSIPRWHINPASEAVVDQVRFLVEGRR